MRQKGLLGNLLSPGTLQALRDVNSALLAKWRVVKGQNRQLREENEKLRDEVTALRLKLETMQKIEDIWKGRALAAESWLASGKEPK